MTDPNAFIFSLVNKDNKPFKAKCSNGGQDATDYWSNILTCFGCRLQEGQNIISVIYIEENACFNEERYADFGSTN